MGKKVLLVHGYEVWQRPVIPILSHYTSAVCDEVVRVEKDFDYIVLLGGQHFPLRVTIAQAMQRALLARGVPSGKIRLWSDQVPGIPPRDTIEEVDVARAFIQSDKHILSVMCLAGYARSVRKLYAARDMWVTVHSVKAELSPMRKFVARHLHIIDRHRRWPVVRHLLAWHRKKRTHMLRAPSVSTT